MAAPFCLSGKCQGVIDIFLTAAFISVPCSRSYDLGSRWPLPVHSFLPYFSGGSGGGGEAYLTENSSIGFQRGVFHFETIFFFYTAGPSCAGAFSTQAIYFSLLFIFFFFEIQLFSMSFDLRFAPKRFGPLMFVKVILSHSEGGGRGEDGGGGGKRRRKRRWTCDTGAWKKCCTFTPKKTKCFQSFKRFFYCLKGATHHVVFRLQSDLTPSSFFLLFPPSLFVEVTRSCCSSHLDMPF